MSTSVHTEGPPPAIPDHEMLRCIGRGSYGEVWLARNVMGLYRAVKVIFRDRFESVRPFEREFEGIRNFEPVSRSHESQVDILHIGRQNGYFYYVMELADDVHDPDPSASGRRMDPASYEPKTLHEVLKQRGRLPFQFCLEIALDLTTALGHLHKHGLVHRDVKPSNIIFVNDLPKLADIGLVTELDSTLSFVGTEGFLPPEGPGSPQADLYALGKVLYEASTGRDRMDFPELPTYLRKETDQEGFAELNEVTLRACDPDVSRRYANAEQMHQDLLLIRAGKSLRRARRLERHLARVTKLGTACLVAAVLFLTAYFYQRHQTRTTERLAARLEVAQGIQLMEEGDLSGSLLWFLQALDDASWSPDEERIQRLRLGAVAQYCPKPIQMYFQEPGGSRVALSADGRRLLTYLWVTNVEISDVISGESLAVLRHSNLVGYATFSADGTRVLTKSRQSTDEKVVERRSWDVETGDPIGPTFPQNESVSCSEFRSDGSRVITGSPDGTAQIWDAVTGKKLGPTFHHGAHINKVAISPDGQTVATAGLDGVAQLWDATTGEQSAPPLRHPESKIFHALIFSPDGRYIASGSVKPDAKSGSMSFALHIWRTRTGELVWPALRHVGEVPCDTRFSPDSRRILVIGCEGTSHVWDIETGDKLPSPPSRSAWLIDADFSPDGRLAAVGGGDNMVHVWDTGTGELATSPLPHNREVWGVRFHPNGRHLVTTGVPIRLWDIESARFPVPAIVHTARLTWAGFSPDGRRILTASRDGTARIWDATTAVPVTPPLEHRGFVNYGRPSFSPDGRRVLTASGRRSLRVWDAVTGKAVTDELRHDARILHAEFNFDGTRVVSAAQDGTIQLWDLGTGALRQFVEPKLTMHAHASFSPDGKRLATIGHATTPICQAQVWDLATGQALTPAMPQPVDHDYSVEFSPDGALLLTRAFGGHVKVWNSWNGQLVSQPAVGGRTVSAACFDPAGKRIVIAQGSAARVYDATTGRPITRLLKHDGEVLQAAFSPDGSCVVTASEDKTARLWDASSGLPISSPLRHGKIVECAEFCPDGRQFITACHDGTARLWRFEPLALPTEDLRLFAQILAGRKMSDHQYLVALSPEELRGIWQTLRNKHPELLKAQIDQAALSD